jgi:exoribonuclease-2
MDEGGILLGYVVSVETVSSGGRKKENYRVVTEKNKVANITASKIINSEPSSISEKTDQSNIASKLIEMRDRRRVMASEVPLAEIRELIMLESKQLFEAREIAAAYYGSGVTRDEASAVVRNLFVKNPYFKRKEDYFFPASDEDVARFIELQEKEALNKKREEEFACDVAALETSRYSIDACEAFTAKYQKEIELFKNSVLYQDDPAYSAKAKDLQQKISTLLNRKVDIFDFLVKTRIFSVHENLAARRYNLKKEFREDIVRDASLVEERARALNFRPVDFLQYLKTPSDLGGGGRVDMRAIPSVTIDSEYTLCCDDAISAIEFEGKNILLVHVSDASEFITEGGELDREAYNRASAVYLAEGKIDIIPEIVSNEILSLRSGEDRFALTLAAVFGTDGEMNSWFFVPSVIKVSKKCSYDEIDELYSRIAAGSSIEDMQAAACFGEAGFKKLLALVEKLRSERESRGALNLSFPKSEVYVEKPGELSPEIKLMSETHAQSGAIVSECMILYNSLSAAFLAKHNAAGCFKSSKAYPEPKLIENYRASLAASGASYDAAQAWAIRRYMQFAETSYSPSAHGMLGVSCYMQSSSPLRRYIDLANQRQIKSLAVSGAPFYGEERFRELAQYLDATLSLISEAEQESHYYWLYLYLKQNAGGEYDGVVIEASEERARIEIAGVYLHVTAQTRIHGRFCVGDRVAVTVETADARERRIYFRAVKRELL